MSAKQDTDAPESGMPWKAPHVSAMVGWAAERYGDAPALSSHLKGGSSGRTTLSYRAFRDQVARLAEGWIELGLQRGDRVMILADNRLEWLLCNLSVTLAGGVDVPRGNDATDDEIRFIFEHSGARFLVVEGSKHLDRALRVLDGVRGLERIVVMDGTAYPDGSPGQSEAGRVIDLEYLEVVGQQKANGGASRVDVRVKHTSASDPLTIIYTSGTTGRPKGVVISHGNMMSQVANLPIPIDQGYRILSILPVWHSYERAFEMIIFARGTHMGYASVKTLGEDLKEFRPDVMVSAPRLWESLYSRILSGVSKSGSIKRAMFRIAYASAYLFRGFRMMIGGKSLRLRHVGRLEQGAGRLLGFFGAVLFWLPWMVMDRLVFSRIRASIGGRFRFTVSGGGALPLHIDRFFNTIGIPVLEGYGMTESSPIISVRLLDHLVIGTVGPIYPGTELRIVDLETREVLYPNSKYPHQGRGKRGVVHVKGPQVMQGYYLNPEETDRVLRDNWLDTGDIGIFTHNDCLKIVGRSKDTIVLRSGENLEPVPIENMLGQSPLIQNCMLVGQDQKHVGLLLIPAWEGFRDAGLPVQSIQDVMISEAAAAMVDRLLQSVISRENGFKTHELIRCWRWVDKPFEIGDELTTTYKLRRHVVAAKHAHLIESMYEN